jgi:hypothetical protein
MTTRSALAAAFVALLAVGAAACAPPPTTVAGPTALNETGKAGEADFCNVMFPTSVANTVGAAGPVVYGTVEEAGVTNAAGANAAVTAQIGIGPAGTDPRTSTAWKWGSATYTAQVGQSDEYQGTAPGAAALAAGRYAYAFRFSFDTLATATYCDINGAGSTPGNDFDVDALGAWTQTP